MDSQVGLFWKGSHVRRCGEGSNMTPKGQCVYADLQGKAVTRNRMAEQSSGTAWEKQLCGIA